MSQIGLQEFAVLCTYVCMYVRSYGLITLLCSAAQHRRHTTILLRHKIYIVIYPIYQFLMS